MTYVCEVFYKFVYVDSEGKDGSQSKWFSNREGMWPEAHEKAREYSKFLQKQGYKVTHTELLHTSHYKIKDDELW
jgi:hypothetical protein